MTALRILALSLLVSMEPAPAADKPQLDYGFFKEKVEPIFLAKRPGHARCVTCHSHGVPPLEPLAAGASTWTEEQSRKNFAMWSAFVAPGNPMKSPLLLHPLAKEAGGDRFHAGGKHWKSQNDPEWRTLAAWVSGQKMGDAK